MKVYKMNDCDWVAAENEQQAKEFYAKETGFTVDEVNTDFVGEVSLQEKMGVTYDELSNEEMNKVQEVFKGPDGPAVLKTFEWVIEHDKITQPCIICTTEY